MLKRLSESQGKTMTRTIFDALRQVAGEPAHP